jgi:hypothetical protein
VGVGGHWGMPVGLVTAATRLRTLPIQNIKANKRLFLQYIFIFYLQSNKNFTGLGSNQSYIYYPPMREYIWKIYQQSSDEEP